VTKSTAKISLKKQGGEEGRDWLTKERNKEPTGGGDLESVQIKKASRYAPGRRISSIKLHETNRGELRPKKGKLNEKGNRSDEQRRDANKFFLHGVRTVAEHRRGEENEEKGDEKRRLRVGSEKKSVNLLPIRPRLGRVEMTVKKTGAAKQVTTSEKLEKSFMCLFTEVHQMVVPT